MIKYDKSISNSLKLNKIEHYPKKYFDATYLQQFEQMLSLGYSSWLLHSVHYIVGRLILVISLISSSLFWNWANFLKSPSECTDLKAPHMDWFSRFTLMVVNKKWHQNEYIDSCPITINKMPLSNKPIERQNSAFNHSHCFHYFYSLIDKSNTSFNCKSLISGLLFIILSFGADYLILQP